EQHLRQYEDHVKEDVDKRVAFIREQIDGPGLGGAVVGISGGIDSAVTAALCVRALGADRVIGVWMPAYSQEIHAEDSTK
ncbi:NAD+ synthase, partial [Microbacteriaceae bacterium K1510]|nr:NAD+ synthase [Microbacteriaceae bacterium K1510]